MPAEPDLVSVKFPERAQRWRRIAGYFRSGGIRNGPVCGVFYRIPAEESAARGVRMAFLSDFHYTGTRFSQKVAAAAAGLVREFQPDYLLFGGDLCGYAFQQERGFEALRFFEQTDCVKLAVPGNWENGKIWISADFWKTAYASCGFRYLENELYADGRVSVYGMADISSLRVRPPQWGVGKGQKILLTHRPDNVVAADSSVLPEPLGNLVLCGHLHGGQIRVPGFGALYSGASQYRRRFDYGLYRHRRGDRMIVTSGLGEIRCPVRMFCRREVVLIELI